MLRVEAQKQLGDFSLDVAFSTEGRVTGLFGSSGAGKTSLVNIIAGLLQPDRGLVAIGDDVLDDTSRGLHTPPHRRRIGYVFQDARLFPHLDVSQNLDYGRRMNGLTYDRDAQSRVVDLLDIGKLLDRRTGRLSGGERQRIALGRALLAQPRLLLLDEPAAGLNPTETRAIDALIVDVARRGVTILLVEHDMKLVMGVSDHILVLDYGRKLAEGTAEEVRANPEVIAAYLGAGAWDAAGALKEGA